jgi:cytochrome P450
MLGLWMAGGQRWKHLRAVAAGPFQLPRLEPFHPRIQALAHELLDIIVPRKDRRIDVVADFARPFYLQVTCLILGLDVLDVPMFDRWIIGSAASAAVDAVAPEVEESEYSVR